MCRMVQTRFLRWMKETCRVRPDEWTAGGTFLDKLRSGTKLPDMSFTTISAWGPNAAMPLYGRLRQRRAVCQSRLYLE